MKVAELLLTCCGFEYFGETIKVYLDSPNPEPSTSREQGIRTTLFHLFASEDAEAIRCYLAAHRTWDVLRVPQPYTKTRCIRALRISFDWHSGSGSPLYSFASTRRIHGESHRNQLRRELNALFGDVLESPNAGSPSEYGDLTLLREVVATAPANIELATSDEVFQ
jgi:hypothetical protein